ncbi:MAG: hypothetical protein HY697_01420 [Deltaproteobacteria bacterium]|nr:hypothetical protein [Deltaproteobacteria bacterium]
MVAGEHEGTLASGRQVFRIGPVQAGQTVQILALPLWEVEGAAQVTWRLEDPRQGPLRVVRQSAPEAQAAFLEWTSNSEPRPASYLLHMEAAGGSNPGEKLGRYVLRWAFWGQNDGGAETDAPESYKKALSLPLDGPGTFLFQECFISGTADLYDVYKISLPPNHSLTLTARPLQWQGSDPQGQVQWRMLTKNLKALKGDRTPFRDLTPFGVKIFHPRIKADTRPGLYFLLVKVEREVSLVYALEAMVKEGR